MLFVLEQKNLEGLGSEFLRMWPSCIFYKKIKENGVRATEKFTETRTHG